SSHCPLYWFLADVSLTCYRHVMLPKNIAKMVPKTHLMSETEWRNLGVQQSQGWVHYMIHEPGTMSQSKRVLPRDTQIYTMTQYIHKYTQ
uniref:Cyclin-dependent kinases regulatory subunit n=1 Tax=Leptobrachium leishanense TaxID=445787 RepID=A0A8C5Q943_9ANUR